MYRDDDKFAGMLAVIEEQQAAANLAVDRLTTIVETLAELGGKDWQKQLERTVGEAVETAVAQTTEKIRQSTAAAVLAGVEEAKDDMRSTATATRNQVKEAADGVTEAAGSMTAAMNDASKKLQNALSKVLAIPIIIAGGISIIVVLSAWWEVSAYRSEKDALAQEIKEMKETAAAMDADPLIRSRITLCDDDGVLRRCVRTDETGKAKSGAWGGNGETYRIIYGLKPAKQKQ